MTPVDIDEIERVVALNAAVGGTGAFLTAAQLVPLLAELRAARKVVAAAQALMESMDPIAVDPDGHAKGEWFAGAADACYDALEAAK